jgi:hypothetical protein
MKGGDEMKGDVLLPLAEVVLGTYDDAWYGTHTTEVDDFVINDLDHVKGFP